MTPQDLFNYANRYARKREAQGLGTQYPTFRQAAKRFRVSLDAIEQACEDYLGDGYMGAGVGVRVGSLGGPMGSIERRADYVVEAYD